RDTRFIAWGDEVFSALFGRGEGPRADPYYALQDFRAKEYNQCYRSAGRYLGWRVRYRCHWASGPKARRPNERSVADEGALRRSVPARSLPSIWTVMRVVHRRRMPCRRPESTTVYGANAAGAERQRPSPVAGHRRQ